MKKTMTVNLDQDQVDFMVVESLKYDYSTMAISPMPEDEELLNAISVVLEYYLSPDDYRAWVNSKDMSKDKWVEEKDIPLD